jgi:hypothetical protein
MRYPTECMGARAMKNRCMTRTVCRTIVLLVSLESDTGIARYTDSKKSETKKRKNFQGKVLSYMDLREKKENAAHAEANTSNNCDRRSGKAVKRGTCLGGFVRGTFERGAQIP